MGEAWIIDAVRTPRGRGKAGKGALSGVHPQELLAQTLNALPERNGFDRSDVEDVVVGCVTEGQRAGRVHRAQRGARRRLARRRATGVTLNRFCGSGLQAVNFAAHGRDGGPAGSRDRRRRRVDVARADGLRRRRLDGHNQQLREHAPDGAAGHLGRPDRDARGLHARGRRHASRAREPASARDRAEGGPLRQAACSPVRDRRRQGRARPRRAPARRHDARVRSASSSRRSRAWARYAPKGERADARPARAEALPAARRRSSTCTTPATRRASSTAPARCCSRRRSTRRRTASSRARASARWRPPAPSR